MSVVVAPKLVSPHTPFDGASVDVAERPSHDASYYEAKDDRSRFHGWRADEFDNDLEKRISSEHIFSPWRDVR